MELLHVSVIESYALNLIIPKRMKVLFTLSQLLLAIAKPSWY